MKIWFDMDGTIADLYGVQDWLGMLEASNPFPYMAAEPMLSCSVLARMLNRIQSRGAEIGIISWLSKNSTDEYDILVQHAKINWLKKHFKSVHWDSIKIVAYGTNKSEICGAAADDILFDDEAKNRDCWAGKAYTPDEILTILKIKK